jgi:hypothetical protein
VNVQLDARSWRTGDSVWAYEPSRALLGPHHPWFGPGRTVLLQDTSAVLDLAWFCGLPTVGLCRYHQRISLVTDMQLTAYMGQGSSRPGGRPFDEEGVAALSSAPRAAALPYDLQHWPIRSNPTPVATQQTCMMPAQQQHPSRSVLTNRVT